MKKIISLIFALLLCATLVFSMSTAVFAAEENAVDEYITTAYDTPEEKIATMNLMLEMHGYKLYVHPVTAEIAVVHDATGQTLFSNPFDIAKSKGTNSTKEKLLSQIIVSYIDNGVAKEYNSYTDAVKNNQVVIEPIKNGVRVEYTIGRADSNYLVPRLIEKSRLESQILSKFDLEDPYANFAHKQLSAFYALQDPNDTTKSEAVIKRMHSLYPVTKTGMAVYALTDAVTREFRVLEGYIKEYAPDYSYDEMEYDHTLTQYVDQTLSTPVFRLAIEYTLTEDGLEATLPANGIRFDETLYKLESITMLPYMGAGNYNNEGYTFVPDGSGALMDFGDFTNKNTSIAGTVYGMDFAYQTLEGSANQDVMRMPVFGQRETVERGVYEMVTETYYEEVALKDEEGNDIVDEETGEVVTELVEKQKDVKKQVDSYTENRGFFAIIKEGDALSKITAKHENQLHQYNAVQISFNPRPKDSYSLESLSVGGTSKIEVVSDRKYVGNYTLKYYMLLDDELAAANGVEDYYETTWMGMAVAYRDYLTETGVLTPLTDADVKDNIPLYIETFGATQTIEKVLSVPTTVSKSITSFENIQTMYDELAAAGITNVNFKLTGYANGGMYATIPYKLKWEKAVGGVDGYAALLSYAAEKGFGVYPDFDFAYVNNHKNFDGLKFDRDILKTIDNRYSSLREYDASLQAFVSYFTLCVSPSAYQTFYEKFAPKYLTYGNDSISLSTIGSALNSDFDEDDPYNRNDAKNLTVDFLETVDADLANVMSESGNVYTWKYVDKMLNVSLQSSRSLYASASVPFMGVVLHGSVEFAGTPINMAGDVEYELLRAIENGAGLYFILSYDNTELLKEDYDLSKYYSVRYEIWAKDDEGKVDGSELAKYYNDLNGALAELQTSLIVGHEFLIGERVPFLAEAADDAAAAEEKAAEAAAAADEEARKAVIAGLREQYEAGAIGAGQTIDISGYEAPEIETEEVTDEYQYTKYTSDDNQIVLVTYDNGTSFILNYNDFAITTVVDGTTYTVDGYGYVVIK